MHKQHLRHLVAREFAGVSDAGASGACGGVYKRRPTGDHSAGFAASKRLMKREPVVLSAEARVVTCEAVRHALIDVHQIEVLAIAVGAMHLHLLARFPAAQKPTDSIRGLRASDPVRHFVRIAKKESAKRLVEHELMPRGAGGVWARKGKIVRVTERSHQVNVLKYVLKHAAEGAAVWSFRDGQAQKKPTD